MKYRVKAGRHVIIDGKCYTHRDDLPKDYEPCQNWIDNGILIPEIRVKKTSKENKS